MWVRASRMRECVLANASAHRGWLPPRRAQQRVRSPRLRIAVSVTRQRSLSVWYEPCRRMVVSCSSWRCSVAAIHFPVSLSFAPRTAIVERCVRVCASVGLRALYKHPVRLVSRANSPRKFGPHVVCSNTWSVLFVYKEGSVRATLLR